MNEKLYASSRRESILDNRGVIIGFRKQWFVHTEHKDDEGYLPFNVKYLHKDTLTLEPFCGAWNFFDSEYEALKYIVKYKRQFEPEFISLEEMKV